MHWDFVIQWLTETDNDMLTIGALNKKILEVVRQMNPLKGPGPDGIQDIFYAQRCK